MRIYMQPIESIAWFKRDGTPYPIKFKIADNDQTDKTIKIEKVLHRTEERLAGNRMLIFRCQAEINNHLKVFELKYEINTCRWYLYKI